MLQQLTETEHDRELDIHLYNNNIPFLVYKIALYFFIYIYDWEVFIIKLIIFYHEQVEAKRRKLIKY